MHGLQADGQVETCDLRGRVADFPSKRGEKSRGLPRSLPKRGSRLKKSRNLRVPSACLKMDSLGVPFALLKR